MNTVGLYIHIPFCKNKCFYCDFPSFSGKESLMVDYAKALSKEIDNSCQDKLISTIFIGGGTPTYLCIEGWKIIAESIKNLNFVSKDFEFTVEGNPNSFNEEQLEIFKTMGVNRISMGLQAVQEHHLKSIGRIHTIEDFKKSYIMLRENGFNNINVDLMFGLPNKTLAEWIESLEQVIELKTEHLYCYSLIIEEGTKFYNLYENESLILPNEDVERDMYAVTKDILKKNGYEQYEISNYAKKGFECKHNKIYWQLNNYVGCGSSSHSYINGIRYRNESNIEKYIGRMNESNTVVVEEFKNSEKDDIEEFMFLGLRLNDGIDIREFQHRFGVSIFDKYKDIIEKYVHMELLNLEENRLFLTSKGMEFSNQVMADFIL